MPGTLRPLGPSIWCIDHPLSLGGMQLGTRTTILGLPDGGLLLVSPGPWDEGLTAAVAALGPVRGVVAPNLLHHMSFAAVKAAFPGARGYGAEGLKEKLPALPIDEVLGARSPWGEAVGVVEVDGMPRIREKALWHPASGTLVLTDMCFNVQRGEHWWTNFAMTLNDGLDRFGPTRAARSMIKDKTAMRKTVDQMIALAPQRVTVTHGAVFEGDGAEALREAYRFLP